jgi:hypothetical protein
MRGGRVEGSAPARYLRPAGGRTEPLVASVIRVVTLAGRAVAVIIVLDLVLTITLVAGVGLDGGKAPLGNKAEGTPGGLSGWSDLGLGVWHKGKELWTIKR